MKLIDYLLAFQKKLANSVSRFVIALWSRQTGKGFTTSFVASRGAMTEPRSKWLIVAPTERQSLETLDKCKDCSNDLQRYWKILKLFSNKNHFFFICLLQV